MNAMDHAKEHEEASRLLPWLVNGTLEGSERERVERHVHDCLACRAELREQNALQMLVRRHPDVHVSAEQGFADLARRLEGEGRKAVATKRARPEGRAALGGALLGGVRAAAALFGGRRLVLANVMAAAVVAGLALWLGARSPSEAPSYSTLTSTGEEVDNSRLDVVFAPGTTQEAMHDVLADVGATIVAGPSDVGRYTVQLESAPSDAELDDVIAQLLADPRVRFAGRAYIEPKQP
ncbi:MAG TPA: zf-HC2 domain-containing protein [Gammaproteobacteria bacterium]|nr:zf-HC2 domain-containing protein [Gammaproteobacteria bacterium]